MKLKCSLTQKDDADLNEKRPAHDLDVIPKMDKNFEVQFENDSVSFFTLIAL
jgi:hypothetical protein